MPLGNNDLKSAYQSLETIDKSRLNREDLGEAFNFKNYTPRLVDIEADLKLIKDFWDAVKLPEDKEYALAQVVTQLAEVERKMINLIAENNANFPNERQYILNDIKTLDNRVNSEFLPFILKAKISQSISQESVQAKQAIKKELREAEQANEQVQKILKIIQETSGKTGVAISSTTFSTEATNHKKWARNWLIAIVVSLMLALWATPALFLGWKPFSNLAIDNFSSRNNAEIAHLSIFKIFFISLLYFIVYQCLRNYKAHRHLTVLNTHRQNALDVYPVMISAAEGDTKQVILREAASSIFNTGSTGYLDIDKTPPPMNLNEIVNKLNH